MTHLRRASATSWKARPLPEAHIETPIDCLVSAEEFAVIEQGRVPMGMDDKWFVYFADGWLHIHRALTGTCVFQVQIVPDGEQYAMVQMRANRDPAQYRNDDIEYDIKLMFFVVNRVLLKKKVAFPAPDNMAHKHKSRHESHVTGGGEAETPPSFINLGVVGNVPKPPSELFEPPSSESK